VTGDVVLQLQSVFLSSFASHDARLPANLERYFPTQPSAGSSPAAVVQVVPGGFVSATQQAREMIDNAEERLDIMNPYLTDPDMIERIGNAAERGVDVRVVVPANLNRSAPESALRHRYRDLIESGVEIWEYPDALSHAKLIIADDTVHFGTLNLDAWSLYRDFEVAIVSENPEAAALFAERVFEPDIAISKPGIAPSGIGRLSNWVLDKFTWFM
jgi:cardiolipin synthase